MNINQVKNVLFGRSLSVSLSKHTHILKMEGNLR